MNYIKLILPFLLVSSNTVFAKNFRFVSQVDQSRFERSEKIEGWVDIVVEKGFILSNHLYYGKMCKEIWKKQIEEFKKKNPHIKNVDILQIGDRITVQFCHDKKESEEINESSVKQAVQEIKEIQEIKEKSIFDEDSMIFLGFGFLSEIWEEQTYNSSSLRYGIKKDIYSRINYKLTMDMTDSVIIASNKLRFKGKDKINTPYLSLGMGNRVGFKNREEIKVSSIFDSYSLIGIGYVLTKNGVEFDVEVSFTGNSTFEPNLYVSGVKNVFNNIQLGAYFDLLSSDPKISNTNKNRKVITGGVLLQY